MADVNLLLKDGDMGSSANRVVKDENGNDSVLVLSTTKVGIGTTNPANILQVRKDSTDDTTRLRITNGYIGTTAVARLYIDNTSHSCALSHYGTSYTPQNNYDEADSCVLGTNGAGINIVTGGNPIKFFLSTAEQMRLSSDGYLGIGTTSPSNKLTVSGNQDITGNLGIGTTSPSYKLDINGEMRVNTRIHGGSTNHLYLRSASGCDIVFETDDGTEKVKIQYDGDVGIGTNNPAEKLDVNGNVQINGILYGNPANDLYLISRTSKAIILKINGSDEGMRITSAGDVGIGITIPTKKLDINGDIQIKSRIYGNSSGELYLQSSLNKAIIFETNGGANEKVRITYDGKVGIGTTNPSKQLSIVSSEDTYVLSVKSTASLTKSGILINADDNAIKVRDAADTKDIFTVLGSGTLQILNDSSTRIFSVLNTGNVGIGTSSVYSTSMVAIYNQSGILQQPQISLINGTDSDSYDPSIRFAVGATPVDKFTLGVDDSDSNKFKISGSNALGSNDRLVIDSNGNIGIGTTGPGEILDVNGALCIIDGMSAPDTHSGKASIYIDSADGDLKIKFGDGTVKTIVTD